RGKRKRKECSRDRAGGEAPLTFLRLLPPRQKRGFVWRRNGTWGATLTRPERPRADVTRPGRTCSRADVTRPGRTCSRADVTRPGRTCSRADVTRPGRIAPADVTRPGRTAPADPHPRRPGRRAGAGLVSQSPSFFPDLRAVQPSLGTCGGQGRRQVQGGGARTPPLLIFLRQLSVELSDPRRRDKPGRPCVDCHAFEFMQRALQDLKKTAYNLDTRTETLLLQAERRALCECWPAVS
uniref:NELL2-interacting cell ontogeny regulator 1 n=1 Tax=Sarcophilus harrisii TaxID=9305 RepID=A0A7N4PIU9_SARHA